MQRNNYNFFITKIVGDYKIAFLIAAGCCCKNSAKHHVAPKCAVYFLYIETSSL